MCRLLMCSLLRCARWGLYLPLLCLLVLLAPATSSASETYTITEAELRQLESNLTRLQQINDSLTQALGAQKNKAVDLQTALSVAQKQLTEARRRQTALQAELTSLKSLSKMQAESLEKANKSFERFAKEEKARRVRIKAQRNTWLTVSLVAATAAIIR